jgi:Tol biopolymer transport system component
VSVSSSGEQGNGASGRYGASASWTGRFAVFSSEATNLVPGPQSEFADVFLHDSKTGATRLVSRANDGRPIFSGGADPDVSGDGRFVVFEASRLRTGLFDGSSSIYLRDTKRGTTTLVSHTLSGHNCNTKHTDPNSEHASISQDGSRVAFDSTCARLNVHDTDRETDIFVWHRHTGLISLVTTGPRSGARPAISADGQYVAYEDWSHPSGIVQVQLYDMHTMHRSLVTGGLGGAAGDDQSRAPQISRHGSFVAFYSHADNLVPGDTNIAWDVFRYRTSTGAIRLASVSSSGARGDDDSVGAWVSGSGRYVTFTSRASSLVRPPLSSSETNAYVHDFRTGATTKVSVSPSTTGGRSFADAISGDGSTILYTSDTTTQIPHDRNRGRPDVFSYSKR